MTTFKGLPKDFFAFFKELAKHNERAWFEANKQRYKDVVVNPLSDFMSAIAPRVVKISKQIVVDREVFFGGGVWMPEPDALNKIRHAIAGDKAFAKTFGGVRGDALSRPPKGFDADHACIDDIKRKSFFAMHESSAKIAQSPALLDEVEATFKTAKPLMKFLCDAVGAAF